MKGGVAPAPPQPKNTLGSLAAAALFGALVAIALLYMWGANIAKERGLETLGPSPGLEDL